MTDYSADFHDFGGAIYMNCAFHGAMPRTATRAVEAAMRLKETPNLLRDEYHFQFPDAYRAAVAQLIGAEGRDVAVANSATQGTMILVAGLDWRQGDEVVIPAAEFPSNRFPWYSLEARGVTVREVELHDADQALEAIAAALTKRTRVVSVSWVTYSTGLKLDLGALGRLCHDHGALLAVDTSQGVGGLRFDVTEAGVDLISCAGYKWMLGPYGTGWAWLRPGLAEELAVGNINWFSLAGARDFNRLSECDLSFEPGARRFDVNEPGNFFNMAGAATSVHYLNTVGAEAVERHAQGLVARVIAGLPAGMHSLAPTDPTKRSNILCITTDSAAQSDSAWERLVENRIFLSRREGALRISPHLFNTTEQVDRLLEVLADPDYGRGIRPEPARGERVPDMTAGESPSRRTLEGRFVRLRELEPASDAADLYPGAHQEGTSEALWAYLHNGPFESEEALRQFLEEVAASDTQRTLTVEQIASGRAIGSVSFMRIRPAVRTLELGSIWYLPEYQRTEVNTESVYLMLQETFDRLGYRRVEWKCDALNAPSRRAAPRLGFTFEGVFRQHMVIKGHNRDTAWYAMLDSDWPRVKANLERWLYGDEDPRPSLTELNRDGNPDLPSA